LKQEKIVQLVSWLENRGGAMAYKM